jgi:hypothetical protein
VNIVAIAIAAKVEPCWVTKGCHDLGVLCIQYTPIGPSTLAQHLSRDPPREHTASAKLRTNWIV